MYMTVDPETDVVYSLCIRDRNRVDNKKRREESMLRIVALKY